MILDEKTFESLGKNFSQANQKEKIVCKCDYCGEVFERMKHNIERSHKVTQSDSCSNKICVQKKRIESNRILFGTDNGFQNENIKAAIKNTVKIKYGVDNVMKNPDIKKRQEDSCEKTLGTRNPFGSTEIQNRIAEKNILKYGVKNPTQNASIKNKQENTNEIIYGVRHALQLEAFRQKAMETCLSNHGKFPVSNYGKTQHVCQIISFKSSLICFSKAFPSIYICCLEIGFLLLNFPPYSIASISTCFLPSK